MGVLRETVALVGCARLFHSTTVKESTPVVCEHIVMLEQSHLQPHTRCTGSAVHRVAGARCGGAPMRGPESHGPSELQLQCERSEAGMPVSLERAIDAPSSACHTQTRCNAVSSGPCGGEAHGVGRALGVAGLSSASMCDSPIRSS